MRIGVPGEMARDLRAEKIGKGEFSAYLVVFIVATGYLLWFAAGMMTDYTYASPVLGAVDRALMVLVTIATLALAYYANKQGDGKRFWYRYISLSFPIALILAVIGFAIYVIGGISNIISIDVFGYPDLVIETLLYAVGLYWTYKYMRVASGASAR